MDQQQQQSQLFNEPTSGKFVSQEGVGFLDPRGAVQNMALVKWLIETTEPINELERTLKGKILKGYKENNEPVYKEDKTLRLMNDRGVNEVMTFLRPLNKMVILSNFTEDDIRMITLSNVQNFIDLIEQRCKEWEVEESNLDTVLMLVENAVFATLRRAKDGNALEFLKMTTKHVESFTERPQPKQGILSRLTKMF